MGEIRLRAKAVRSGENALRSTVKSRTFELTVDEPTSAGGSNMGPNPIEVLLSSLLGCINVIAYGCAKELGIEMESLELSAVGSFDPAKSKGEETSSRAGVSHIEVTLNPTTEGTPEQLEEWIRMIEERCPIADTLRQGTEVEIGLK